MLGDEVARRIAASLGGFPRGGLAERDRRRMTRGLEAAVAAAATARTLGRIESMVRLVDPRRESALESLSFGHMVRCGLPRPELQFPVQTEEGTRFADFAWPQFGVIGEADGEVKYSSRRQNWQEKRREDRVRRLGYRIVRWGWADLRSDPDAVMLMLRSELVRGGLAGLRA